MNFIFDNTYVLNSSLYRDVGELYEVYDKPTGKFLGYRAVAKKLINQHEVCHASFPLNLCDLTVDEMKHAKRRELA